jgi:hydroxypyruvate isomerase
MKYSACIEWLFAETGDFPARIRAAKAAGLDGVEFWFWSNKDLNGIAAALNETGIPLKGMLAEPMIALTEPANHEAFLEGLKRSIDTARRLNAPMLIAQAGDDLPGRTRAEQHAAIVDVLGRAADALKGSAVVLGLEPLNTRVDHKGYYLSSTEEGLDIADEVNRSEIGIVYDIYHSAVMDEDIAHVLNGRLNRVVHAHLADAPGRQEPGSGSMDWRSKVNWLSANGYGGVIGLEYKPTGTTVASLRELLGG